MHICAAVFWGVVAGVAYGATIALLNYFANPTIIGAF